MPRRVLGGGNAHFGEVIKCPECRQPTRVPPEGLPINYRLQELLSHVAEVSESSELSTSESGRLRKCLSCDDAISKGVYLLCRTCCGEGVIPDGLESRQLCSMCCLRHHNGHKIEEKRFLTMNDVIVARDAVSEATGLGYQYVDMAMHDISTVTDKTKELIQVKAQAMLQEFENIANDLQFELLSSNDELDSKVAAAIDIRDKLENFSQLVKDLVGKFHGTVSNAVNEFAELGRGAEHEAAPDFGFEQIDAQMTLGGPEGQTGAGSSGECAVVCEAVADPEDRRSLSKSCAMLERRVHQHRMAQQHYHTQRKRARAEYHVPNQLKTERDRRERLREQFRKGFLEDEAHSGRRRPQNSQNGAGASNDQQSARKQSKADVQRSRSIEIISSTPPAVHDLEERAERLIITPQRRREHNECGTSREGERETRPKEAKIKIRRGRETSCGASAEAVGDSFSRSDQRDPTLSPFGSMSGLSNKLPYGVNNSPRYCPRSPELMFGPGPSSILPSLTDSTLNIRDSGSGDSNSNNDDSNSGNNNDGESVNAGTESEGRSGDNDTSFI